MQKEYNAATIEKEAQEYWDRITHLLWLKTKAKKSISASQCCLIPLEGFIWVTLETIVLVM